MIKYAVTSRPVHFTSVIISVTLIMTCVKSHDNVDASKYKSAENVVKTWYYDDVTTLDINT